MKSKLYHSTKRMLDITGSFAGLILLAPLLAIIALTIRLTSPGPALFTHQRIGKDGKPFMMHKFRTMHSDTKTYEFAPQKPGDPRITKFGHFLRRTSLDELPQLYNILKGEMSLVGPRPEMPFIVAKYTTEQAKRLQAKPGLTGLWQINGRKDLPLHENLEHDLEYIQNQSILLDLKILVKTIKTVITGRGAY